MLIYSVLLSFLLALLLLVYILLDTVPLKIDFLFDTESGELRLLTSWLGSFLTSHTEMVQYTPILTVELLGKRVYRKALKMRGKKPKRKIGLRTLALSHTEITLGYGFSNPFVTGMTSGALELIKAQLKEFFIEEYPDFLPGHDYLALHATARLNLAQTAVRALKGSRTSLRTERRDRYGSVEFSR